MRLLYFHQYFTTPQGSGGTRSYEMARRLVLRGHSVTMICGGDERSSTGLSMPFKNGMRRGMVDGIDVIELKIPYSNNMGKLQRITAFIKFALRSSWLALTLPCDLVFATTTPLTAGFPGILARWFRGKKFVFEVRDLWPELPRAMGVIKNPLLLWLMGVLEWASYKSAHKLIGLAPGIVEGIARRGVRYSNIIMIPNGCDLNTFHPGANQPLFPHTEPDDFIAVFSGAHGRANGLDAVLDAAVILKQRGVRHIKLCLIGQGSEKAGLQARARAEQSDNVLFFDPIPKMELARLMSKANLGLQLLADVPAFYHGTSPNKFFDYLAAGLPILTNYPGWIADIIELRRCGFTVPPDDPPAFADALVYCQKHREECAAKGNAARALAEESFDRDKLGKMFVDYIEQCLNEN